MPTSAAGSDRPPRRHGRGFTLIELLVVVAIVAIGSAGVAFALRDSAGNELEREAARLAALFDAARAQSRSTGQPLRWRPTEDGFRFEGALPASLPERWLGDTVQVAGPVVVVLGPEPVIGPQEVVLASRVLAGRSLRVVTDGLRPFRVLGDPAP